MQRSLVEDPRSAQPLSLQLPHLLHSCNLVHVTVAGSPWDTSSVACGTGSAVESPPLAASGVCGVLCSIGGRGRHTSASTRQKEYKGKTEKHKA